MCQLELLRRPPGREEIFAYIQTEFPWDEACLIEDGYDLAKAEHTGQMRDDDITPYFDHPAMCLWIYVHELHGRDVRIGVAALLHDTSEPPTNYPIESIAKQFGRNIAEDVRAVTKDSKTLEENLRRISDQGPRAILVKLIDRLHNIRTLDCYSPEARTAKIDQTVQNHLKILLPALRDCGEHWAKYADAIEKLYEQAFQWYQ